MSLLLCLILVWSWKPAVTSWGRYARSVHVRWAVCGCGHAFLSKRKVQSGNNYETQKNCKFSLCNNYSTISLPGQLANVFLSNSSHLLSNPRAYLVMAYKWSLQYPSTYPASSKKSKVTPKWELSPRDISSSENTMVKGVVSFPLARKIRQECIFWWTEWWGYNHPICWIWRTSSRFLAFPHGQFNTSDTTSMSDLTTGKSFTRLEESSDKDLDR